MVAHHPAIRPVSCAGRRSLPAPTVDIPHLRAHDTPWL
ncbi:hypothetical protein I553_3859 [Mycobacterium xenopi 4042]|uniref:Uncharacterized protein n=1 Tax=Mycobacterium xenopi 4042 TaxID=1299334 RepID=X8APV4_MYCXE|nr:hypothetical protein I553_3859 [Mycobacterium xenopi 4042]